jgi:methyl-accepting chemotaxis protein
MPPKNLNPFNPDLIASTISSIDELSSKMLQQFGVAEQMAQTMRAAMSDSLDKLQELGGEIADVQKTQLGVTEALGRNVLLSAQGAKDLYASFLVTGKSVKEMVEGMANIGISAYNTANEMKKVVDIARESGVNVEIVTGKVLQNMDYLNRFNFEGGVSGLAKMAAQASMLRIDMNKTLGFAERVFNPEGAIETAAALQRLGVAQGDLLDPLKLMDLSQNDPAELQNQIAEMSKRFVQLGKDGHFEIMPGAKRQLYEIAEAMKIPYSEITKMALGGAELDKKLKEISFSDAAFSDKDREMIANMSEMKGGEYVIKVGDEDKKVSELQKEDIDKLKEVTEAGTLTMEELATQQLSFTKNMDGNIQKLVTIPGKSIARMETTDQLMKLVGGGVRGLTKSADDSGISSKNIGRNLDKAIIDGTVSFADALSGIKTSFSSLSDNLTNVVGQLNTQYPLLSNIVDRIIKNLNPTTQGRDVLKMPGQDIQLLPEDTFAAFTKGSDVLSKLTGSNNTPTSTPTSTSTNSSVDLTHTLNINITAPSNVNTDQIIAMFNDTGVSQALGVAVKEAFNNGGLTTTNPNKQQLRNPGVLQYS